MRRRLQRTEQPHIQDAAYKKKHVSPSNWTEISFSERKVTTGLKWYQTVFFLKDHNIRCQRPCILVLSTLHAGWRTCGWQPSSLPSDGVLLSSLSSCNEQTAVFINTLCVGHGLSMSNILPHTPAFVGPYAWALGLAQKVPIAKRNGLQRNSTSRWNHRWRW